MENLSDKKLSSSPTEIREYETTGRVVNSFNNEALEGVDVSITTSVSTAKTKTNEFGMWVLKFKIPVVVTTEEVNTPFEWNKETESRITAFDWKITKTPTTSDRVIANDRIEYTINYNNGEATGIGYSRMNGETPSNSELLWAERQAKNDIENQLEEKSTTITYTREAGYKVNETPPVKFNFPKYNPQSILPYKGDNTVKYTNTLLKLVTTKKQMEKDISQSGTLDEKTTKEINKGGSRALPTPQKTILKVANTLSDKLLPYIIGILAAFGITQIKNWLNGKNTLENTETTCPSLAKLNQQIRKRNRIVKQLNNIYKVVDAATKAIGIALGLLKLFQLILNIFKRLPIPSTIGLPPGPAGGVITSASYGKLIRNDDKYDKLKGKLAMFAKIGGIVLTALILLRSLLSAALNLLSIADQKMQECMEQYSDEIIETQIALSDELVAISQQQAEEELSPVIGLVNGFKMGVETDPKYKVGTLDRRRATATNPQGVIMLRGEPSFSASDQILIDELAFYITSNNLKA